MNKRKSFIVAVMLGFLLSIFAGCGTGTKTAPSTHDANRTALSGPAKHAATPGKTDSTTTLAAGQQQDQILHYSLHYTTHQINQIKQIAKSQEIIEPYVLTKEGGRTGVYGLVQATGNNFVLTLAYENITVLEATYFDNISNSLQAFAKDNQMTLGQNFKLNNGVVAQWCKIAYGNGNILEILTLRLNKTWVALITPAAWAVNRPQVQAMAESLRPVDCLTR